MKTFAFIFITGIFTAAIYGQGYPGWTYSAEITINTTSTGADIPGGTSVASFPVLVKLGSGYIDFSQIKTDGSDIRFSNAAGTPLPYEMQSWNHTAGNGLFWILVDNIAGNAVQTIKVYWGNATAVSESSGPAVFGSEYVAVWHLDEEGNTEVDGYKDATANQVNGTGISMTSLSDVKGMIGKAQHFDGVEDFIDLPSIGPTRVPSVTYSWWNNQDTRKRGSRYAAILRSGGRGDQKPELEWSPTYGLRCNFRGGEASGPQFRPGADEANPGEWHHFTIVFDSASAKGLFYLNGELHTDHDFDANFAVNLSGNAAMAAWSEAYGPDDDRDFHDAAYDEFQVAARARSAEWIKLTFENQKPEGTLAGLPRVAGCSNNFGVTQATVAGSENSTISIGGSAVCAERMYWAVVNGNVETPISGNLPLNLEIGRLAADSTINLRLKALYGSEWQTADVTVIITKTVPDPVFSMPAGLAWDGRTPLEIIPNISNTAAIAALSPPYNTINYSWSFNGTPAARTLTETSMILRHAYSPAVTVNLCLDNGSSPICQELALNTGLPTLPNENGQGPVQIFIMAGQSNTEGHGMLATPPGSSDPRGSLEYLVLNTLTPSDFDLLHGNTTIGWAEREDVWIKYDDRMGNLKAGFGVNETTIGPELGFGNTLGNGMENQVLLLKVCRGGRALATNFRPPSSGPYPAPVAEPDTGYWYEQIIFQTQDVIANLDSYFPEYSDQGFKVAGLAWHQGWNDWVNDERIAEYPTNMANLIRDVRDDLSIPGLPVVIAESGMTCYNETNEKGQTFCANQVAPASLPEFAGTVAGVETRDFYFDYPGTGFHWNQNAESYFLMGQAMGDAMLQLVAGDTGVVALQGEPSQPFAVKIQSFPKQIVLNFSRAGNYATFLISPEGKVQKRENLVRQKSVVWNTALMTPGVYFLRIRAANKEITRKLALLE